MVDTASNLKYMDGAAVATTLQQEPIDQESQVCAFIYSYSIPMQLHSTRIYITSKTKMLKIHT
jgi:hypothetical protein